MRDDELKSLVKRCCDGKNVDIKKLLEKIEYKDIQELYIKIKSD